MKLVNLLLSAAILFASCKKEMIDMETKIQVTPIDSAATYKIIVTGLWKLPMHTIPAGNHFTPFIGMVHSSDAHIFSLGALASKGVEDVAEVGNSTALENEIAGYLSAGKGLDKFVISLPGITGTDSTIIHLSSKKSLISFVSMIAPSPDWFVGVDSYNLIQKEAWVKDITIAAAGYDAGTENGNVFSYDNTATTPQQNISYLTPANASVIANGNTTIAPFTTIRFVRQ